MCRGGHSLGYGEAVLSIDKCAEKAHEKNKCKTGLFSYFSKGPNCWCCDQGLKGMYESHSRNIYELYEKYDLMNLDEQKQEGEGHSYEKIQDNLSCPWDGTELADQGEVPTEMVCALFASDRV